MASSDKPHEQSYGFAHFTDGKKGRPNDPLEATQLVSVVTLVNQELEYCLMCCQTLELVDLKRLQMVMYKCEQTLVLV